jgi:Fur family transcriptional regulator, ferric uptake regulator
MKTLEKPRISRQRRIILEELQKVKSHPSAQEIYDMVRRRLPRVSLGTVYRNLEILAESGLIRKLESSGAQRRFDSETTKHYHVRCLRCNRIVDLPFIPLGSLENYFSGLTDYLIMGHRLEFVGLCPECRQQEPDEGKLKEVGGK